jgi:hypothetical protein
MRTKCLAIGLAAGFALLATQAWAGTPAPDKPDRAPVPVADTDLAEISGGTATLPPGFSAVLTSQSATNSNNLVSAGGNVTSGDVDMGQGALQGFAGIGNFVFNTGHNNNLLGSLSVAINMMGVTGAPAP